VSRDLRRRSLDAARSGTERSAAAPVDTDDAESQPPSPEDESSRR
jgi:hypothetical protein